MTYEPPVHFAVENRSQASDRDVAYWAEACRLQLIRDVCPAWGDLRPPGVAVYPRDTPFPPETALVCVFVDDIGDPGTLGEHGVMGGTPFALIDAHLSERPSVTLSHELIETTVNQWLDRWTDAIVRQAHVYRYPLEPADAVEGDTYNMNVTLLDGLRDIQVSSFVLPAWFDVGTSSTRFDHLGRLSTPLEIASGGYVAPEIDGVIECVFGSSSRMRLRRFAPWGRLHRLVQRHRRMSSARPPGKGE